MKNLNILMVGAHPDDCEVNAGGFALMHRARGNRVKFVSVTDGRCGHMRQSGQVLAERRKRETEEVSRLFGIEYEVWNVPDGEAVADIALRKQMVACIRSFAPDLILTHRLNDYHPDHRATATLVADASYLLIVPGFCPEIPALEQTPPIALFFDNFETPPFCPDYFVDVEEVMAQKFDMLHCHQSQMYEWLPYTTGQLQCVPQQDEARREWLKLPLYNREKIRESLLCKMDYTNGECKFGIQAEKYRSELTAKYGLRGQEMKYVECFCLSEYGGKPSMAMEKHLFI